MQEDRQKGRASAEHTEPVDIEIDELPGSAGREKSEAIPARVSEGPAEGTVSYENRSPLIEKVTITPWQSKYDYYRTFRQQAKTYARLVPAPGYEPHYTSFFSYMPQYSQLDARQFDFYVWLRSEIRHGRFPETDFSYVQLLIYETLNLSDLRPPEETLDLLVGIWCGYREVYSRLDTQMSDWVCDFCLIHNLPVPFGRVSSFVHEIIRISDFREFWFEPAAGQSAITSILVNYCSNYDYRKSKFAAGENASLYDRHMNGVVGYTLSGYDYRDAGLVSSLKIEEKKTVRDAFVGALCIPEIRKRIAVRYLSVTHSYEFRFIVTDLLKYTENRLRAVLGIKSRISVGNLPKEIRDKADEYFELQGLKKAQAKKNVVPDYEKYYDREETPVSAEKASEIERSSWDVTEKLVCALSDEDAAEEPEKLPEIVPENVPETPAVPERFTSGAVTLPPIAPDGFPEPAQDGSDPLISLREALSDREREFILACTRADREAQKALCAAEGKLPDMMASSINEKAADFFGDIILGKDGPVFTVIEDYAGDVKEVFGE